MKNVLFICVHNAGRSQMAAAFLHQLARGNIRADSAGTMPSDKVNPRVVQAMQEKGIDISKNRPRLLTQAMVEKADRIITMGCSIQEACPAVLVPSEDWGLEDPEREPLEKVRAIRDLIEARVGGLIAELATSTVGPSPSANGPKDKAAG